MIIQDVIFSVGNFAFDVALIPSLISQDKPNMKTSIPTSLVLFIFSLTFQSLGLYLSAVSSLTGAVAWAILAYQVFERGNISE